MQPPVRARRFAPWLHVASTLLALGWGPVLGAESRERSVKAAEVFDYTQPILFQDDFRSGKFGRWRFSENADYGVIVPNADRMAIVQAPGLAAGRKAVRFVVPRAPNSFRAELSLPHEDRSTERWYGERIFIPREWVIDGEKGDDIVMQWHGVPGNWRATFPNLAISISGGKWWVKQNYGKAQTGPTRTADPLPEPVRPGTWVSFVVHAKWSPGQDGFLKIWQDGRLVIDRQGPNIYTTIGVIYSPYFKTGIYHPNWNLKNEERRVAFSNPSVKEKTRTLFVTDVKVGGENARYEDIVPPSLPVATQTR